MISVPVTEASQVAEARRRAIGVAQGLGFDETATGRVAIVATELATNLVKYGDRAARSLLGAFEDETGTGVEILALDKGAGLCRTSPTRCATAIRPAAAPAPGSAPSGASRRPSTSSPGPDGAPRCCPGCTSHRLRKAPPSCRGHVFGAVAVPLRGETANGDAYCVRTRGDGWTVIVADGLGHGPLAAQASDEAVRAVPQA